MRRKVEEGTELRRQLRKLEEKNSQYIQQNLELEEVNLSSIIDIFCQQQNLSIYGNIVIIYFRN